MRKPTALAVCNDQQSMLNLIWNCVSDILQKDAADKSLAKVLREIKEAFAERDYDCVFASEEKLSAYIANYTSSRCLCYYDLFWDSKSSLRRLFTEFAETRASEKFGIICLGAGSGGEMLALSRVFANYVFGSSGKEAGLRPWHITVQDKADYGSRLAQFEDLIRTRWEIPHEKLSFTFSVSDLLDDNSLDALPWLSASLVTLGFVANELFAQNKKLTVQFLLKLVNRMSPGSFLLVIDSAGSFSDICINGKSYYVYDLLDPIRSFRVVEKANSQWFRVPKDLNYGLKLNNTRYFYRLYEKL